MERDHNVTQEKYVDYLIATQNSWDLDELKSRKQFDQVAKALEKNTRVRHLYLRCNLLDTNLDYYLFASSLDGNNSLESLSLILLQMATVEAGMVALLNAMTRKPKLNSFVCYGFECTPSLWSALLDFVMAHPDLKNFSLPNATLTEAQVIELMDILKDRPHLTSLNLLDSSGSFNSLRAIALGISGSTKMKSLAINENEVTAEEVAQIVAILQTNTSLEDVLSFGPISTSEFLARNRENNRIARAEIPKYPKIEKPTAASVFLPDSCEPGIHKLPLDLLRAMLWELPLTELIVLKRVDKKLRTFLRDQQFWQSYYLKYHSSIPEDVLSLTDLTYGLKSMAANSLEDLSTTIWEEIVVNSHRSRDAFRTTEYSPLLQPVYRQYPQLISTASSAVYFDWISDFRTRLKWKKPPYANAWFVINAGYEAVYHLGFEKLHDGQYNGILFVTPDLDEWEYRFQDVYYIFEWFAAKNEAEFAEKIKPLCELFLAIRKSKYQNFYVPKPLYNHIGGWLRTAVEERSRVLQSIGDKLEQAAKSYFARHAALPDRFADSVYELTTKFKEAISISDATFEQHRSRIPPRSIFNTKYNLPGHDDLFYNFDSHDWGQSVKRANYHIKHRKYNKKIPHVVLLKMYRVVLNSVMMPILKTFWPTDIRSSDGDLSHHMLWTNTADLYNQLFDFRKYIPISQVSVSKAYPSFWPLISVGLANLLLPEIVALVDAVLEDLSDDSLAKLISNSKLSIRRPFF